MLALMGSTGPVALTLSGQPRGLTLHYSERRCPLRRGIVTFSLHVLRQQCLFATARSRLYI